MSRPWRYMLWPPNMVDRKILLERALNNDIFSSSSQSVQDNGKLAKDKCEDSNGQFYDKLPDNAGLDLLQLGIVFIVDWSHVLFG